MSDNIFKAPTSDETAQQMADCLPDGRAWALKNDPESNIRKLINCLATVHNRIHQQIELMDDEYRINNTYDLLDDWEKSVGIPDSCFASSTTISQRQQDIIDRLRKQPIVTLSEMQNYVNTLFPGMGIVLYPGHEFYTFEYDFEVSFLGDVSDRFILVTQVPLTGNQFEYEFELEFEGGVNTDRLECLLNKINPANVYIIIESLG